LTFQASPYQSALAIVEGRSSNPIVGYDALSNTIIKLRKALGDKARNPHIIETIAKTGYRLIAEVSLEGEVEQPSPTNVQPEIVYSVSLDLGSTSQLATKKETLPDAEIITRDCHFSG